MYSWLEQRWMGKHQKVLTNAGYTLDDIKAAKMGEVNTILKLFHLPGHRLKIRLLIESLKAGDTSAVALPCQPAHTKQEASFDAAAAARSSHIEAKRIALQKSAQVKITKQVVTDDGDVSGKRSLFEAPNETRTETAPVSGKGRHVRSNTAFRKKKAGIAAALQRQMLSGFAPPHAGHPAFRPSRLPGHAEEEDEDEEELPDLPPPAWDDDIVDNGRGGSAQESKAPTSPIPPEDENNQTSESDAKEAAALKRKLFALLSGGAMFRKYKRGSGKDRLIWCDEHINNIFWGDKRRSVKGQMQLSNVKKIVDGCKGAKIQQNALTIVSSDRTLELEALSEGQKQQWKKALSLAIQEL